MSPESKRERLCHLYAEQREINLDFLLSVAPYIRTKDRDFALTAAHFEMELAFYAFFTMQVEYGERLRDVRDGICDELLAALERNLTQYTALAHDEIIDAIANRLSCYEVLIESQRREWIIKGLPTLILRHFDGEGIVCFEYLPPPCDDSRALTMTASLPGMASEFLEKLKNNL
jgi:hypothetical protein